MTGRKRARIYQSVRPVPIQRDIGVCMIGDEIHGLIPIWQGFHFSWSYNHRINRLGSRVSNIERNAAGATVTVTQAAATGTGPDTCLYKTAVAVVSCAGIRGIPASNVFRLRSRKGRKIEGTQEVRIRLDNNAVHGACVAILNGYDLAAQSSSQKILGVRLSVSPVAFEAQSSEYAYTVSTALSMDCRSIECNRRQTTFDYLLRVDTLFIVGVPSALPTKRFSRRVSWTRTAEAPVGDGAEAMSSGLDGDIPGDGRAGSEWPIGPQVDDPQSKTGVAVVLALRMLDLSLSSPKWLIEWAAYLDAVGVPEDDGSLRFNLHLFYKAWRSGMRKHSFEPRYSRFALREKGVAELAAELVALRFPGGTVYQDQSVGAIRWAGRNSNPNRHEAVKENRIIVPSAL